LSGILLAFNAAHDAAHNTFSKHARVNNFIYLLTFNLQGVSGYLWKIRHRASHHIFPNVDGCDADIDDNIFLRLSPAQAYYRWHKYQHVYATLLYLLYTLHWIFIKDFIYLKKKELANLRNQQHSVFNIVSLILWKLFYLFYMVVAPIMFGGFDPVSVLISFLIMHAVVSLFFVLTLIISHLCMETKFPTADQQGMLPYGFHRHQLEVSMDYNPTSVVANWIFGGFNSHSAHHLFSSLPHTLYAEITPLISQTAVKYKYTYNELTFATGILSHYSYLKKMGNAST
jgi:linoleoyl-CoA desaturase